MMIIKTPRSRAIALIDFLLTALAWFAFCYLFLAGVRSILKGTMPGISVPLVSRLLPHVHTLMVYVLVAAGIGLLLFLWASYNAMRFGGLDRRKPPAVLPTETLAASFGLNPTQIKTLHTSQNVRIHHTAEGQISLIDFSGRQKAPRDNVVPMSR